MGPSSVRAMSDQHLSSQFSQILDDVAEAFPDVQYGSKANMALVGGLHLPVSKGIISSSEDGPGRSIELHIPHESGDMFYMNMDPDTGNFSSANQSYDKHAFSPEQMLEHFKGSEGPEPHAHRKLSKEGQIGFNKNLMQQHMEDTQRGRVAEARFWPAGGRRKDQRIFDFDLQNREIVGER